MNILSRYLGRHRKPNLFNRMFMTLWYAGVASIVVLEAFLLW